ncbi:DedA family protein [Rhodoluna limnophila]|uniref:DedA family protein n=1 Tax=Rhodoluna limnophila TaxID=232537 RepID=UPI001561EE4F|nr:DedA family protein [Rhodoluna limnophila]
MNPVIHLAISDEIATWYDQIGPWLFYGVVWGLVFAGTGLFVGAFVPFVTGDSLVFAAGLVAAGSAGTAAEVNIWVMAIGVGVAAWLGDQVGYALGRHFGRPYLDKREGKWLRSAIAKSEAFYNAWGWWAVVISRFMPWARVIVPAIAGISRMNYYLFFSANLVGALTWGTGLTVTGYFAASIPAVKNASYAIAIFFILASLVAGFRAWMKNRAA